MATVAGFGGKGINSVGSCSTLNIAQMLLSKNLIDNSRSNRSRDTFFEAVSKALLLPPAPKRGFVKCLHINNSPFGDLGANKKRLAFDTAS